jgi:hypothetical protein
MARITSHHESGERYFTLRIVAVVSTGVGVVLLAVGMMLLAFGLWGLLADTGSEPPRAGVPSAARPVNIVPLAGGRGGVLALLWSLGFLVSGLQFLAMAGLCRLAIHVEENTRASAQCLEKIRLRLEPRGEDVGPLFIS